MTELVVATRNAGKIRELEKMLEGLVATIRPLSDFPGVPEVEEDGATFEENAVKKACAAVAATGLPALADDSGLCVDALDGRPGVFSARFAGAGAGDAANNQRLLAEMAGVPTALRSAAFHCCLAFGLPDGTCETFTGTLPGHILEEERGEGGFGYDPLFLVTEYGETLAELSVAVKNGISHRGTALKKFRVWLESCEEISLQ